VTCLHLSIDKPVRSIFTELSQRKLPSRYDKQKKVNQGKTEIPERKYLLKKSSNQITSLSAWIKNLNCLYDGKNRILVKLNVLRKILVKLYIL